MSITIRQCNLEDVLELQKVGYETFDETFRHQNSSENMDTYLAKAFDLDQVKKEVSNSMSQFYLAYLEDKVAGYLKINIGDAQSEEMGNTALEIERIYVHRLFQQRGIGRCLFNKALDIAVQGNKDKLWLGVWEKNQKAIAFYEKLGFIQIGTHAFYMGDEEQIDFIMVKDLLSIKEQ